MREHPRRTTPLTQPVVKVPRCSETVEAPASQGAKRENTGSI